MNRLLEQIREAAYPEANSIIRKKCGIVDCFSCEDEKFGFVSAYDEYVGVACEDRASYGDWQTPQSLADKVCLAHLSKFGSPDVVIEPTCGLGAFVLSAMETFPNIAEIHALEINPQYVMGLKLRIFLHALSNPLRTYPDIYIYNADFFGFDFSFIVKKSRLKNWNLGIIGNPPWVTNSRQGKYLSQNTPVKRNLYGLKGIDAITGKSNFDISEHITLHLLGLSQQNKGGISFLLKNSVIRSLLYKQKLKPIRVGCVEQEVIDAPAEFNVAVDASCFFARFDCSPAVLCSLRDFYTKASIREYGWVGNSFVSDVEKYHLYSRYDNRSAYVWRSGIKHDCASVLELVQIDGKFVNGLGETVEIEEDLVFPLLKSADINNYHVGKFRKFIIVPQHKVGEDTASLKYTHPLAYAYLMGHLDAFSRRKSTIYKGKDKFSVFGVGDYSFKPYKIVVSSLYKTVKFLLVTPFEGKPVMVDDTCYQIDFETMGEAACLYQAICSDEMQSLLDSLVFTDAKRVVTKSLLMRLDLVRLCNEKGIVLNTARFNEGLCAEKGLFD